MSRAQHSMWCARHRDPFAAARGGAAHRRARARGRTPADWMTRSSTEHRAGAGETRPRVTRADSTRRIMRAAAVFGATPASAFCGLTVPAHAEPVPDNAFYTIRPEHSDKCLDVAYLSKAHGGDVVRGGCWNGPNQRWCFASATQ
ncbi:RICIN domain-containing protein [Streptomyces sp. NPDC015127]|uniref:RICIN domain-containing protein n=1 Tax=Streptomyces sp. NPDC015127 TaxID=3364939 RepID=UPI0036FD2F55